MKVLYMFQVEDRDDAEMVSDAQFSEIRNRCTKHCENLGLEEVGHGMGLGEWSHLGESWDFQITMDMAENDFWALEEEYGLYLPEGEE